MTDTEQTPSRRAATESHRAKMEADRRRQMALDRAVDFHINTCVRDADYLRTVRSLGVETRSITYRDVIETANAFDLFLMGQGPLVAQLTWRLKVDKPNAEPTDTPPETVT